MTKDVFSQIVRLPRHTGPASFGIGGRLQPEWVARLAGIRTRAPAPPSPPRQEVPGDWDLSLDLEIDPTLLFRFSALTYNAHRIHYDRDFATGVEGYPGLVVHGPLQAIGLAELCRRGVDRPLAGFEFRAVRPVFDDGPLRLRGQVDAGSVALVSFDGAGRPAVEATVRAPALPLGEEVRLDLGEHENATWVRTTHQAGLWPLAILLGTVVVVTGLATLHVGYVVVADGRVGDEVHQDAIVAVILGAVVLDRQHAALHQCVTGAGTAGGVADDPVALGEHVMDAEAQILHHIALDKVVIGITQVDAVTGVQYPVIHDAGIAGVDQVDAITAILGAQLGVALDQAGGLGLPLERIASVASFFVSRVDTAVDQALGDLRKAFNDLPEVCAHLDAVRNDLVDNAEQLIPNPAPQPPMPVQQAGPDLRRYRINVMVSNGQDGSEREEAGGAGSSPSGGGAG